MKVLKAACLFAALAMAVFHFSDKAVAAEKEGGPCHVIAGPNLGKSGKYDKNGACANKDPKTGWGATECGEPKSKCANGTAVPATTIGKPINSTNAPTPKSDIQKRYDNSAKGLIQNMR